MTFSRGGAIGVLVDHVSSLGGDRRARQAARRWAASQPVLAGYASPADLAAACRTARGAQQDTLLAALLAVSPGDAWAQLTIVAGLAERLGWVVSGWVRGGMDAGTAADAEAELVAACWAAVASWGDRPPPERPGLALVDRAWEPVRVEGRRRRRVVARTCVLTVKQFPSWGVVSIR